MKELTNATLECYILPMYRKAAVITLTHQSCTKCGILFERTSKMTLCKPCNSNRVKCMTPEWKMHQRAKVRSKVIGYDFDIAVSDIVIPEVCPVFGLRLNMNSGRSGAFNNSPSLDRIDNAKGYVKGNIQVISQKANKMKDTATPEELRRFAYWILSTFPE